MRCPASCLHTASTPPPHHCIPSRSLGGPVIVRKGAVDAVADGRLALECGEEGSPRRAGGQVRPHSSPLPASLPACPLLR